ncbi:TPA: hypothetical protein ACHVKA_000412 [Yersinia enterocolitica]
MNNLELSNPVAWTDADELADMDCNTYGNIFNAKYIDIHNGRWLPLYSQGYIDFLIAQLEAAQKLNPLSVNVSELEATYIGDIRLHMAAISDWKLRAEKAEAALSAANEKLKGEQVPVAYFAAAPDYGWDMFNNKEDAIATCQAEIDAYRECRDDGWDDDVQRVCWGIVIQKAEGFDHQGVHTSNSHHTYQTCDYSLQPVSVEGE